MPKRTVELLDDLQNAGFTDIDFRIVHHRPDNTIAAHRKYCTGIGGFEAGDSTNSKVRQRLELIANAFRSGFTVPARPGVLRALAEASVAEIPKS